MKPEIRSGDVTRGFAAGGLVALACAVVLPSVLQAAGGALPVPRVLAPAVWTLPIPLSLAIGGLVAGGALERGGRGRAAICAAMLAAGVLQTVVLGDAGRLTGRENPLLVVTIELVTGAGAFAVGGACAGWLLGAPWSSTRKVAAGFAGGGLLGSIGGIATFFLARAGAGAALGRTYLFVLLLCQALAVLGPFLVGGVVIGRVLEEQAP